MHFVYLVIYAAAGHRAFRVIGRNPIELPPG